MLIILTPFPLIIADKKYSIFYQKLKLRIVRRYVRQVGEWRGFLSPTDRQYIEQLGLNQLMWIYIVFLIIILFSSPPPLISILILSPDKRYSAYLCTTLSTVVAMVASFLGSQHTFCFLQVITMLTILVLVKMGIKDKLLCSSGPRRTPPERSVAELMVTMAGGETRRGLILRWRTMSFMSDSNEQTICSKFEIHKKFQSQTPGPKPHPNWVYRHHFTAEERTEVQRSLSMLQQVSLLTAL